MGKEIYWEIQFKHREKNAGKDKAFLVTHDETDSSGALENAIQQFQKQGGTMSGEFRVYVYKAAR